MNDFLIVLISLTVFGLIGFVLIFAVLKILYVELGIKEPDLPVRASVPDKLCSTYRVDRLIVSLEDD